MPLDSPSRSLGAVHLALPVLCLLALVAGACGSPNGDAPPQSAPASDPGPAATEAEATNADQRTAATSAVTATSAPPTTIAGPVTLGPADRPAQLLPPLSATAPAPLLVVLHGYAQSAGVVDAYLGVTTEAASRGLYVLLAEGTSEGTGERFWDAGPACCNFTGQAVDDVSFLAGLIEPLLASGGIDPERVYLLGYSNGGFMTYRLACERADLVTAVVVVAGADVPVPGECRPREPVSVLHVHGTADLTVDYQGGQIGKAAPYPGAAESVARWAARNHCDPEPAVGIPLDLDRLLPADETVVSAYVGCDEQTTVQLYSITGADHEPMFVDGGVGALIDWLLTQR